MVTRLRSLIKKLKANKARRLIVLLAIFALLAPVGVTTVTADPPPGCTDVDKDCLEPPLDLCPDQTEDFQGVIDGCPEDGKEPPTNGTGDCVGDLTMAAHWTRLRDLDPVFRASGWQAWLLKAGISWDTIELLFPDIQKDARQIEEETDPNIQPLASGIQVKGTGVIIGWPNILTTDRPGEVTPLDEFQWLPTTNNPSVLYTNVVLNGQGTIWIDGTNWGQFASVLGCNNDSPPISSVPEDVQPPVLTPPTGNQSRVWCLSAKQLDNRYGIVRNAQGARNGLLIENGRYEGAVIHVTPAQAKALNAHGWTVSGTNPTIKSAWNPESCRTSKGGASAATFRSVE